MIMGKSLCKLGSSMFHRFHRLASVEEKTRKPYFWHCRITGSKETFGVLSWFYLTWLLKFASIHLFPDLTWLNTLLRSIVIRCRCQCHPCHPCCGMPKTLNCRSHSPEQLQSNCTIWNNFQLLLGCLWDPAALDSSFKLIGQYLLREKRSWLRTRWINAFVLHFRMHSVTRSFNLCTDRFLTAGLESRICQFHRSILLRIQRFSEGPKGP